MRDTLVRQQARRAFPEQYVKLRIVPKILRWGPVPPMGPGDGYRVKALELRAMATCENDPGMRAEFENLARAYMRLAKQADRKSMWQSLVPARCLWAEVHFLTPGATN
jgi:hypothetical protein